MSAYNRRQLGILPVIVALSPLCGKAYNRRASSSLDGHSPIKMQTGRCRRRLVSLNRRLRVESIIARASRRWLAAALARGNVSINGRRRSCQLHRCLKRAVGISAFAPRPINSVSAMKATEINGRPSRQRRGFRWAGRSGGAARHRRNLAPARSIVRGGRRF